MWLVIGLSIGILIGSLLQMVIDDRLEEEALKHYRSLLMFHWSLEYKKEKEMHNE